MAYDPLSKNYRRVERIPTGLPIQLSFGSQITLQGQLKDISLKSAFVKLKESVFMENHEEFQFAIKRSFDNLEDMIVGSARISRIAPGEGIAIYFTKMDEDSSNRLRQLVNV